VPLSSPSRGKEKEKVTAPLGKTKKKKGETCHSASATSRKEGHRPEVDPSTKEKKAAYISISRKKKRKGEKKPESRHCLVKKEGKGRGGWES